MAGEVLVLALEERKKTAHGEMGTLPGARIVGGGVIIISPIISGRIKRKASKNKCTKKFEKKENGCAYSKSRKKKSALKSTERAPVGSSSSKTSAAIAKMAKNNCSQDTRLMCHLLALSANSTSPAIVPLA